MPHPKYLILGCGCAAVIAGVTCLSAPLHCWRSAIAVSAVSILAGIGAGSALALITRTRNAVAIYLLLILAGFTLWPIFTLWPPADSSDVIAWKGAPDIVYNYFDLIRMGVYLLALPYPFAKFGVHSPDPQPEEHSKE